MASDKPTTKEAFAAWSTDSTCGTFTSATKIWYETTQNNLLMAVQDHDYFSSLSAVLQNCATDYAASHGTMLFAFNRMPELRWNKKTYDSFLEKIYRINCIDNDNFPQSPPNGWVCLDGSYEKIDDIVRTTLIVGYADAPEFLAARLNERASNMDVSCAIKDHAKEKGYYAHHVYVGIKVPVASQTRLEYNNCLAQVEVQITTELQGALREITHVLYEQERMSGGPHDGWKQDFSSDRFRAAYMAHSLRFIEAMIVELRERIHRENHT